MPGRGLEPRTRGFLVLLKMLWCEGFSLSSKEFPQFSPNAQKFRCFWRRLGFFRMLMRVSVGFYFSINLIIRNILPLQALMSF